MNLHVAKKLQEMIQTITLKILSLKIITYIDFMFISSMSRVTWKGL